MKADERLKIFLGNYDKEIVKQVMELRVIIDSIFPEIIEQVDLPANSILSYIFVTLISGSPLHFDFFGQDLCLNIAF